MSRRSSRASISDGEFMLECKAAYLSLYDDVKDEIKSKDELAQVLQQAGRNPTSKLLAKYWTSSTDELTYDEFVDICRKEPVTTTDDLMKAFRKIDINGDGYISLDELYKIMTTKGEKMSRSKVKEMIDEVDENRDGKLDYGEFCQMITKTTEEWKKLSRKVMERKEKKKRLQLESQKKSEGSLGSQTSVRSSASHRSFAERPMSASARSTASAKSGVKGAEESVAKPLGASHTSLKSERRENRGVQEREEDAKGIDENKEDIRASRASLKSNKSMTSRKTIEENQTCLVQDDVSSKEVTASHASLRSNKSTSSKKVLEDNSETAKEEVSASRTSLKSISSRKASEETSEVVKEEVSLSKEMTASQASLRSNKSTSSKKLLEDNSETAKEDVFASRTSLKSISSRKASEETSEVVKEEVSASRTSLKSNKSILSKKASEEIQETATKEKLSSSKASLKSSTRSIQGQNDTETSTKLLASRTSLRSNKSLSARVTDNKEENKGGKREDESDDSDSTDSDIVIGTPRRSVRSDDRFSAHRYSLHSVGERPSTPKKRTSDGGIFGSFASIKSAGMSNSRRSLLSVGEKDILTPVPAQRKSILSRLEVEEDDLPRPSPRSNKSQKVKGEPVSRLHLAEPKNLKEWTHSESRGMFFIDEDEGSLLSHQYTLKLKETTKVWCTIEPTTYGCTANLDGPMDTALFILRNRPDSTGSILAGFTEHRDGRGKYGVRCELSKGTYHLVPFTTGCRLRKRRSEPSKAKSILQEKSGKYSLSKSFKKVLEDIFDMSDLDCNGTMSREEFNLYNLRTSGEEEVGDDEWGVVEENLDLKNGEITKDGFIKLNEMEAEDSNGDDEDMWVTLESYGFNKELVMDEACSFKINVYTEDCDDADLQVKGIDPVLEKVEKAVCQSIMEKCEPTKIKGMKDLFLYSYVADSRSSILLDNRSYSSVKIELDCEGTTNCLTNQESFKETFTVKPNSQLIAFHFIPDNEDSSWSMQCKEFILG